MPNSLRSGVSGLCALLGVVLLAACGGGDAGRQGAADGVDDVAESARFGGTAVVASIGDIPDISPLTSTDKTANDVQLYALFTPLIAYDENFEPVPRLARSWEVNPENTLLTFHLRDDVFWHDGPKTTAYDVKFSYDRARDPNTAFPNTAFWTHYGEAEVVDSFTIRFRMEPHADFLDPWRAFAPAPRHILENVASAELKNHPFATTRPVGNGPFRFVSRTQGQNWVFEANPDFPAELGGRPYLDRLVYRSIPEQTTLLTELLTGRIDYYIAPSPENAQRIQQSQQARLITYPDRAFVLIGWNHRRPQFADPRVRRALTMAINRDEIIEGIMYGFGTVANSTVPPFYWNHDPQAGQELRYDPDGARRLLAEAGWTPGPDGVLRNAQGQPFRFTLVTNQGNQERIDITQKVQSDLARIGIQARPQQLEWGTLLSRLQDVEARDFDAVVIGWVTEFRIDDTDLFACDKRNDPYQWVGYCNPRTDRLLERLPLTVDRSQAKPLWEQYQRQIAADQPYTFLYFQERREGVSNRLRNVDPDARGDWVGAQKWYIHPDGRRGGVAPAS